MRKVVERELQRQNTDLKSMLTRYKQNLLDSIHDPAHKEVLFPRERDSNIEINNVTKWDILVLANTILTVFDKELTQNEKREIRRILAVRENYVDAALSSLDQAQFLQIWTDLTSSVSSLAMVLDEDVKTHCDELIANCPQRDGVDQEIDNIQTLGPDMKTFTDIFKGNYRSINFCSIAFV